MNYKIKQNDDEDDDDTDDDNKEDFDSIEGKVNH